MEAVELAGDFGAGVELGVGFAGEDRLGEAVEVKVDRFGFAGGEAGGGDGAAFLDPEGVEGGAGGGGLEQGGEGVERGVGGAGAPAGARRGASP